VPVRWRRGRVYVPRGKGFAVCSRGRGLITVFRISIGFEAHGVARGAGVEARECTVVVAGVVAETLMR